MKKVLFISFDVPFDGVGHAGGKTHNYYLKKVSRSEEFETFLISFCIPRDLQKTDCDKYNIDNKIFCIRPEKKYRLLRGIINISSRYNPWNKYAGMIPEYYVRKILGQLNKMKKSGYRPDIIILEWTSIVLLAPIIKKIYPEAKLIASEHDVSFLGYKRKYAYENGIYKKWLAGVRYKTMHRQELKAINICDYVFPHNHKDAALLLNESVPKEKIHPIVPYYMDFTDMEWIGKSKNVVFFGAMSRPENHLSAIWFIENVMPLLKGTGVVFQVIGGGASEELKKMESENVRILGFIEDVSPFFQDALCMAAPLVLGAGIKVKVIEGMSSGMPVLTNKLGIEGIYAKDGEHYCHCEKPKDYADCIKMLINDREKAEKISAASKELIKNKFDMEKSADKYIEILKRM
ncbi:MAG: glycosyltransferase family 4 protein [Lachnospiraceae bacterium]|nr:glycosyltransferase family 4 protein [Lachnospiraceae bacterium]